MLFELLTSHTRSRLTLQNIKLKSKESNEALHTERTVLLHSTEKMQVLGLLRIINDAMNTVCAVVQLRYKEIRCVSVSRGQSYTCWFPG